jgi:hypothetical protein
MLELDRTVSARVDVPPERCLALLADVPGYPRWSRLVSAAEAVDDDRVRLRADVLGLPVIMDCVLELGDDRATLRRVPYDADDDEVFVATWTVGPAPTGADVELHVQATIDAPGPARLLRGRVERRLADDLLEDFAAAVG